MFLSTLILFLLSGVVMSLSSYDYCFLIKCFIVSLTCLLWFVSYVASVDYSDCLSTSNGICLAFIINIKLVATC
jgi:hypothetical protein